MPLILILGGLAALGWATAIVLYVLGLCQAAARGDRALEQQDRQQTHNSVIYTVYPSPEDKVLRALDAANRRR